MQRIATSCSLKVVPRQQQHLVKVNLWRCNRHHPMRTLLQLHRPAPLTTTTSTPHHVGRPIPAISCRCYTRVIYQYPSKKGGNGNGDTSHDIPEILPQTSSKTRPIVVRFLNPWVDLSNVTDDAVLAQKVDSVTRTFGVVAGLMCSLSAAALAVIPSADEEHTRGNSGISSGKNRDDLVKESQSKSAKANENNCSTGVVKGAMIRRQNTKSMYSPNGQQVSGTSLLATIGGLSSKELADIYAACCAGSFYSSVCAMGLSAVLNAWLACTPAGGTKYFVRHNSVVICSIPGFLALSTGLAGSALFIGLDRSTGTPVSYIGLLGTAVGGLLIGSATVRGMVGTYRLLTPLVRKGL